MSSVPFIPPVKFTRQNAASTASSLSTRTVAPKTVSPEGSPVLDVASMCTPSKGSPMYASPTTQENSHRGYQGQHQGYNRGYQQQGYNQASFRNEAMMGVPTFRYGVFAGLRYQDVVTKNEELMKLHDRALGTLTPYACGNECCLEWDFVQWFNNTYKRASITQCTSCSYTTLIKFAKFPDTDEFHPGESFTSVWEDDRDYFENMENTGKYINLRWLYERRMKRIDAFPAEMQRCKHAGKTFAQVMGEAPQYFQWLSSNYSGKDDVYLDAIDWWHEHKASAPQVETKMPVVQINTSGALPDKVQSPVTSEVTDTTKFTNGKHRTKTMWQVYVYDPDYFVWIETKCTSKDPLYEGAVAWYHDRVKKDSSTTQHE